MIKAQNSEFQHSNWNGWMKRIHAEDAKLTTQIDFLPVIEGDPNDHRTIFTTLKECLQLSKEPSISPSGSRLSISSSKQVFQLFQGKINAILSVKSAHHHLYTSCRLGSFHLLKSYLESMGNIMDDSGLLELIQHIYPGSTTAHHILNGGCFDKAIRAHLLIDAALYQHVMKNVFIDEELSEMTSLIEEVADKKMEAQHTAPIVAIL